MKIPNVRAGGCGTSSNRNAKKLAVKRPRGVIVRTGVRGGTKTQGDF